MSWHNKAHKFKADRVKVSGVSFASKLEASVYSILLEKESKGELRIIRLQPKIYLTRANIGLIPDFLIETSSGELRFVEAKGFETPEWNLKKKLFKFYGPAPMDIYKGSHLKPKLFETITPKGRGETDE